MPWQTHWVGRRYLAMSWGVNQRIPGLVNIYKKLWNITIFNGKINYFYGKSTIKNGKSPFLMGKSTISMAIFNSYVKLPAGRENGNLAWFCMSTSRGRAVKKKSASKKIIGALGQNWQPSGQPSWQISISWPIAAASLPSWKHIHLPLVNHFSNSSKMRSMPCVPYQLHCRFTQWLIFFWTAWPQKLLWFVLCVDTISFRCLPTMQKRGGTCSIGSEKVASCTLLIGGPGSTGCSPDLLPAPKHKSRGTNANWRRT